MNIDLTLLHSNTVDKIDITDTYSKYGGFNKTGLSIVATLKIPTISNISATAGKVTLKWNKINGADGYYVYRKEKDASEWITVATVVAKILAGFTSKAVSE